MALPGYKATAVDGSGDTIGSTQVEVRRRSDNALASLFDAATSGSALTNPFNADANGDFEFFAAADDYIVTLGSGSSPQVFPLTLINYDEADTRYAQLSGASFTGSISIGTTAKIGTGVDAPSNGNELAVSRDQTNVGMTILSEDSTGFSRLYFGTQTDKQAAKVQYTASSDELVVQSGGALQLQSGGSVDRLIIDSSGDVGIGTASPATKLHVQDADNTLGTKTGTLFVEDTEASVEINSASGGDCYIYFTDGNTSATSGGSIKYAEPGGAGQHMALFTGGAERMRIDSSGNLGVKNNNPQKTLDVTGNAAVSGTAKIGTGADGPSNGDDLVISKTGNNIGMTILCGDTTGNSRIYLGSQTDTTAARIHHNAGNDRLFLQAKGELHFQTGGSGTTMTLNGSGDLDVTGALSKGSGSFKIDHPLKPETHHLVHSFIEGPQADNLYRGTVDLVGGAATVNLDTAGRMTEGTFVALNGNVQCFTSNEQGWTAVKGSVSGNTLTIEAQDATCTDTVSWMVIGERKDQHMIDTHWTDAAGRVITEPEKPPVEEDDTE